MSFKASGGYINQGRILFQNLYAVKLLSGLILGKECHYDAFSSELKGDFHAWSNPIEGETQDELFIEVKTTDTNCVLCKPALREKAISQIFDAARKGDNERRRNIKGRVVYNRSAECGNLCLEKFLHSKRYRDISQQGIHFSFEPFLSLNPSFEEFRSELIFLERIQKGVVSLLEEPDVLARVLRQIVGIVTPYHCLGFDRREPQDDFEKNLRRGICLDRDNAFKLLREALGRSLEGSEEARKEAALTASQNHAVRTAARDFREFPPKPQSIPGCPVDFPLSELDRAIEARAVAMLLQGDNSLLESPQVFRTPYAFRFMVRTEKDTEEGVDISDDLVPLGKFLASPITTHRDRVRLVVSFLETLEDWSFAGIVFQGLKQKDLYFVRLPRRPTRGEPERPQFVTGDLGALALWRGVASVLDRFKCGTKEIAEMLRVLYYGSNDSVEIRESSIYRAAWNDNVILEFCLPCRNLFFTGGERSKQRDGKQSGAGGEAGDGTGREASGGLWSGAKPA